MTIMNAAFTIGAMLSGSASETPGLLLVDDVSSNTWSNVSITSCTAETVVVTGSGNDSLLLRPGHILAYIGNNENGDDRTSYNDGSICTNRCSPLFRKIVAAVHSSESSRISREDSNEITYTTTTTFATTFATFSEVFPQDLLLDESIADAYVEPQFDCGHSASSTSDQHTHHHRQLRSSPFFCAYIPYTVAILRFAGCCLPCCIPCFFVLVNILMFLSLGCFGGRRLYENHQQGEEGGETETETVTVTKTMSSFPPNTCEGWMNTDSNGNCLYVNCNIASINFDEQQENHPSGQGCFSWGNNDISFHENHQGLNFDHMSNIAAFHDGNNYFSEAWCMQDYCYSSKFSKTICDNHVFKVMSAKCDDSSLAGAQSKIATKTSFPLTASVLDRNCHILAMIFYLNMKLLGYGSYNHLQMKQLDYQETMCKSTNTLMEVQI